MSSHIERTFTHAGMDCVVLWHDLPMVTSDGGHRCGYVNIPEGHPWHGIDYNGIVVGDPSENEWDDYERRMDGIVRVHGGLTYSGRTLTGSPEGWWVGFDCAHYMDTASVCTEDYVADQCKSLAEQIAAVAV